MGRALALSKLESIKEAVKTLDSNIKSESQGVSKQMEEMLTKNNPSEIDSKFAEDLGKKATSIMAQFPKINELEHSLEIQDEDPELTLAQKSISSNVQSLLKQVQEGNKKIRDKLGEIPEGARVLTESQFGDQMSFVLKH